MKFVCERCHTKYSIADEKVRGKVLKVRCKTCTNVITVRETGASIDDPANAGPREASVSQSGGFDAGPPTVANAAPVMPKAATRGVRPLPVDALFAPGVPAAAPPPRRPTPPPASPVDDVEWYLAVDGAQTGPFSRARLIDKVLATPKAADVHVWNASFGEVWKAPKDVAEVEAELVRRRRAAPSTPPPPARRTGAVPVAAAGLSADASAGVAAHAGAVGAAHTALDSAGHAGKASAHHAPVHQAPVPKKNGVGPTATVSGAGDAASFSLGDMLGGDVDAGLTPPPSVAAAVLAKAGPGSPAGIHEAATVLAPPPAAGKVTGAIPLTGVGALGAKAKQVKLLLGAAAVVAVVCGIVLFWLFRKPTASVAAAPPVTKPNATDFAGLAEKLAKEEAEKIPVPPPVEAPPVAIDVKPIPAKIEPPARGQKNKKGRRSLAPPPLSPTSPPALTADQRAAASRFVDSTGREVRVPSTGTTAAAHSTPAQGDISRVINNNRQGIQTCYQRALLRDNSLTNGKITVRVNIGLSGRVKSVSLDAPAQFRTLEPCIREVMSRWAFPPSSEEYGTEFPVVLQGNQ